MELRDFLFKRSPRPFFLDPAGSFDRLVPVFLDLVDGQQRPLRAERIFARFKRPEGFLGTIQQTRLQEILAEFEQRVIAFGDWQIGAAKQVLMHANGPVRLSAAAKQVTERKVQFDGFRVELRDFNKGVDGLVGCSLSKKFRPRKYERGRLAFSDSSVFRS